MLLIRSNCFKNEESNWKSSIGIQYLRKRPKNPRPGSFSGASWDGSSLKRRENRWMKEWSVWGAHGCQLEAKQEHQGVWQERLERVLGKSARSHSGAGRSLRINSWPSNPNLCQEEHERLPKLWQRQVIKKQTRSCPSEGGICSHLFSSLGKSSLSFWCGD